MKIAPKNLTIGLIVVGLLIVAAAWYFSFSPNCEEAERIANSNKTLEARIAELNGKLANRILYQEGIKNAQLIIDSVLEKYGPGNTSEKTIMLLVDTYQKTGAFTDSASFSDESMIFQSKALDDDGKPLYEIYKSSLNYSVKLGYTGFKKYVDYINSYPEKMNIESFSLSYDSFSGILLADLNINLYSVKDANHKYEAPVIEDIPLGNTNIFRTVELVQEEGEEGSEGADNQTSD